MKRSRNKRLALLAVPVALAVAGIARWATSATHRETPLDPGIGVAQFSDITQQVTVSGTVIPVRKSLISPPYNAYVKKIFVKLGQHVEADQPILTLAQSLRGGGEELYPLRAPFAGRVVQVLHTEGEYLETGKEGNGVVRIDDQSKLLVTSDVPESDIGKIRSGQEVNIKVNSILERMYHGRIREISLAAKDKKDWGHSAVEFEVRLELTDADARVQPGMSTIVDIITAKREHVLTLPQEFVEKRREKYFATLASGERKEIRVGLQNEDRFEIVGGLKENDQVRKVDFAGLPVED